MTHRVLHWSVLFCALAAIGIVGCEPERSQETIPLMPATRQQSAPAIPKITNVAPGPKNTRANDTTASTDSTAPPATSNSSNANSAENMTSVADTDSPASSSDATPMVEENTPAHELMGAEAGEIRKFGAAQIPFCWCPPGRFKLESIPVVLEGEEESNETGLLPPPDREVILTQGFWIAQTEVTQQQWEQVVGTTPWEGRPGCPSGDSLPAMGIPWDETQEFCQKLTAELQQAETYPQDILVQLPTEAQWEYACRAGSQERFSFGPDADESSAKDFAFYHISTARVSRRSPSQVGLKRANNWGLYDMHGNVAEWCRDIYTQLRPSGTDPVGDHEEIQRVARGGHFDSAHTEILVESREAKNEQSRSSKIGLRPIISFANPMKNQPSSTMDNSPVLASTETNPIPIIPANFGGEFPAQKRKFTDLQIEFTWCRPGKFELGSPPSEAGRDSDEDIVDATLAPGFWISTKEITQQQYMAIMNREPWGAMKIATEPTKPAVYLTWPEADNFCRQLTIIEHQSHLLPRQVHLRLPTEAEWEFACRASFTTPHSIPEGSDLSDYAHFGLGPQTPAKTGLNPGAQLQPNAWGLFDMHGNVSEWCYDYYSPVHSGGQNPDGPSAGDLRVVRGGSWQDDEAGVRSAARTGIAPGENRYPTGLRVVLAFDVEQ